MNSYTLKKFDCIKEGRYRRIKSIVNFHNQREEYYGYLEFDLQKFEYYKTLNKTSVYFWTLNINSSWNYDLDTYTLFHLRGVRQFLDV